MLSLSELVRIYVCLAPTDMRIELSRCAADREHSERTSAWPQVVRLFLCRGVGGNWGGRNWRFVFRISAFAFFPKGASTCAPASENHRRTRTAPQVSVSLR